MCNVCAVVSAHWLWHVSALAEAAKQMNHCARENACICDRGEREDVLWWILWKHVQVPILKWSSLPPKKSLTCPSGHSRCGWVYSSSEQIWITCSPMDPLQWMGAVRMRVQTADKNITIIHTTPVHQLMSCEVKTNPSFINTSPLAIIHSFLQWKGRIVWT